jgi:type VI secretion system Hcp family effector
MLIVLLLVAAGTTFDAYAAENDTIQISAQSTMLPGLDVSDFIIVSSRRTGRTIKEYVLKLKVSNSSSVRYQDVVASLVGAPQHIAIIDGVAKVGEVPPNSTILSEDTFTIRVNLAISTSFDDFVWLFDGDIKSPPPPSPQEGPTSAGIFMNIDDLRIPGDSASESHRNWIELTEVMDGLRREGLGAAGTSRSRSSFIFDGLQAIKDIDSSTPMLRQAIAEGIIFTEVKIDIIRSCDGNLYTALAITLSTTRIDGINLEGSGEALPVEEIAFDYTRIESMYTPVDDDCSLGSPIYSTQDGELLEL